MKGRVLRPERTKQTAGCLAEPYKQLPRGAEAEMGLSTLPLLIPLLSCYTYGLWNSLVWKGTMHSTLVKNDSLGVRLPGFKDQSTTFYLSNLGQIT